MKTPKFVFCGYSRPNISDRTKYKNLLFLYYAHIVAPAAIPPQLKKKVEKWDLKKINCDSFITQAHRKSFFIFLPDIWLMSLFQPINQYLLETFKHWYLKTTTFELWQYCSRDIRKTYSRNCNFDIWVWTELHICKLGWIMIVRALDLTLEVQYLKC